LHNGGLCTVTVADDYNQSGTVQVQVMGDLTPSTMSPPQMTVGQGSDTITFSKTFDSEKLLLWAGGPCLGIVTATTASGSFPSTPSHTTANASVTITPVSQGTCALIVQDQYGEQVVLGVKVSAQMASWPEQIKMGAGGSALSYTPRRPFDLGLAMNAALIGGVARAATTSGCMAYALTTGGGANPAPSQANAVGVYTDANGCYLNGNGGAPTQTGTVVVWEPGGQIESFQTTSRCSNVAIGTWDPPSATGIQAGLPLTAGPDSGQCTFGITDGVTTTPTIDHGLTNVVVQAVTLYTAVTCTGFVDQEGDRGCDVSCEGTSGGCSGSGRSITFPCNGTNGVGPFDVATGEGTDTVGLQINPGQSISVTTSSDGTAFVSASNCASS
jgi:hypothetical protein